MPESIEKTILSNIPGAESPQTQGESNAMLSDVDLEKIKKDLKELMDFTAPKPSAKAVLIDYDNVHKTAVRGLSELAGKLDVTLVYTAEHATFSDASLKELMCCAAHDHSIHLTKVTGGDQHVDMFIATKVGSLIERGFKKIYVVSNDKHLSNFKEYASLLETDAVVETVNNLGQISPEKK